MSQPNFDLSFHSYDGSTDDPDFVLSDVGSSLTSTDDADPTVSNGDDGDEMDVRVAEIAL